MAVIDELLVGLGFDYDDSDLNKFKEGVNATNKVVSQLIKVAVAAATAITGMTVASTRASDEQGKLAAEIGDTVENIDALQFALRRTGGEASSMGEALRGLAVQASAAARGTGRGLEAFGILGISLTNTNGTLKTTTDLFLEVSDALQRFDSTQQIELATKIGLRSSIRLLQQGSGGIRELIAEAEALGVTTAQDAAIAADFQDSLTDIWAITKQISRTLTRELVPIMQSLVTSFTEWWIQNRQIIEQQLPIWIERLAAALKLLVFVTGAWLTLRLGAAIITLIGLIGTLTAAVVTFNVAAAFIPALIIAGLTLIALVAEDVKVFLEGGDSVLGSLIEKFPILEDAVKGVRVVFNGLLRITDLIFSGWAKIINLFKNVTFGGFIDGLKNIPGFIGDITGLSKVDGTGVLPDLKNSFNDIFGNNNILSPTVNFGNVIPGASAIPTSNRTAYINTVEIKVEAGLNDPGEVANSVNNVLQQTSQDLTTTVDQ